MNTVINLSAAQRSRKVRRTPTSPSSSPTDFIVYILQAGSDGPIKIGTTRNIDSRLDALQTASALPLELIETFPGSLLTEAFLHSAFSELRLAGEWFKSGGRFLEILDGLRADGVPNLDGFVREDEPYETDDIFTVTAADSRREVLRAIVRASGPRRYGESTGDMLKRAAAVLRMNPATIKRHYYGERVGSWEEVETIRLRSLEIERTGRYDPQAAGSTDPEDTPLPGIT